MIWFPLVGIAVLGLVWLASNVVSPLLDTLVRLLSQ